MSDIIEYAEAALKSDCPDLSLAVFVPPLIAELKAAHAENARLQTMVQTLRDDVEFYEDQRGMWER